ncbi:MAG TPA: methyltransferase domain-containing protein [Bacteroidales bacterium]|nr:methyltransferase domain-containing protein [Bacteroidales bacterium]
MNKLLTKPIIVKKNGKNGHSILGPVDNLETYLRPDWWRRIFNSMYLKTDADVVDDKLITKNEVELFTSILNMPKESAILDLACGQGRHSIELAQRGYTNVTGLDRSHYLIRKAKSAVQQEGLKLTFKEGDARKLPFPPDTFDVVMILGNSFGYFESNEDDAMILKEVFRVMKPGGTFLIDVADGSYLRTHFQARSWEWIDKKYFVCRERSLAKDNERLISREIISHVEKGIIVDQFYAERLYSYEMLTNIFTKSGYQYVKFHDVIESNSVRNQDLGMMERRIIMTARVLKQWTPVKAKTPEVKNVLVMLGDPTKPDIVKPSSIFDDDDFITIEKLKTALSSLQGNRFTYLNYHKTLYADLLKNKQKIDYVFNLCDEGYNNDARKELHIPALLEILGIPYSGSGPQSLAYCYDKSLIRGVAKEIGVPIARAFFVRSEDNVFDLQIDFPVIAKPNFADSSFGITQRSVANSIEELNDAILKIRHDFGYESSILVEEFLTGKEISVGIIGNPPESYITLPIIEEDYSQLPPDLPKICGYEAKWVPESPYFNLLRSIPAELPEDVEKSIIENCVKLFTRLECRDYCRFDFRLDSSGIPRLLEVNPNPGWCWDGHLAKMAGISNITYPKLLEMILQAAEQRISQIKTDESLLPVSKKEII